MHQVSEQRVTSGFTVRGLRPGAIATGHVLSIDHFRMSQPTFPPHPHAGFSAVTWMLPWSEGSFQNRDSHGDRTLIAPGALHWTLAGSGMLHEEIPTQPGLVCEGLQIFVKLPEADELTQPRAFHVEAGDVPRLETAGSTIRVLAGELQGVRSHMPAHADTTLLHVETSGEVAIDVPLGVEAFAYALRGQGRVAGIDLGAGSALSLSAKQQVLIHGTGLCLLVAWSAPLPTVPRFDGPFCMFQSERLAAARAAYRSGQMGQLKPSEVVWTR